jgi:HSP20 family protein
MTENKKTVQNKEPTKKSEITVAKKPPQSIKPVKRKSAITKPQQDVWKAFDETFNRFRKDFENLLFPSFDLFAELPETRIPAVDLEDRGKDYLLKAEMPGFKKEDIEINVQDDGVEISGVTGWKYNQKEQAYICKERACKSFYRYVDLPEEIKVDDVNAKISEGVLEITLPKKAPKQKRKIAAK